MPANLAEIDFLADLPIYQTEKPYLCLLSPDQKIDPDQVRLDNLEFERHSNIKIEDIREHTELRIDDCGFEYVPYTSAISEFTDPADVDSYKQETERLLEDRFKAEKVLTYELRLRKNQVFRRKQFDVNEKLLVEGPAMGAHNDVTYDSGPKIIQRYLTPEDQTAFLRPGYRARIFNTWRPLNGVLEDRPLAMCDSRSIDPDDLIAADRILPDRVGEVYYLRHNAGQRWYWLEKQKSTESFIFLMYDTMSSSGKARCILRHSRSAQNEADVHSLSSCLLHQSSSTSRCGITIVSRDEIHCDHESDITWVQRPPLPSFIQLSKSPSGLLVAEYFHEVILESHNFKKKGLGLFVAMFRPLQASDIGFLRKLNFMLMWERGLMHVSGSRSTLESLALASCVNHA